MNYTIQEQDFQHMVTDMSRRHKQTPEEIGAAIGRHLREHPVQPPEGLSATEKKIWEVASMPHTGLQEEVYGAFVDLINAERPIMPPRFFGRTQKCSR